MARGSCRAAATVKALDTLHDGLAGHGVGEGGLQHREPAVGGVVDEQGADVVGEADPPGGAGGELRSMWRFAATLRKGGGEGPTTFISCTAPCPKVFTYKQNSLPRSWHTWLLKFDVHPRRSELG